MALQHPVMPEADSTHDVFQSMLETFVPRSDRLAWERRWQEAKLVERHRRAYDEEWTRSLGGR